MGALAFILTLCIPSALLLGGNIGLGLVTLALGAALIRHLKRTYACRARAGEGRARATREAYARAAALWQALVFCHRCDGVFVPGAPHPLVPAARVQDVLHSTMQSGAC